MYGVFFFRSMLDIGHCMHYNNGYDNLHFFHYHLKRFVLLFSIFPYLYMNCLHIFSYKISEFLSIKQKIIRNQFGCFGYRNVQCYENGNFNYTLDCIRIYQYVKCNRFFQIPKYAAFVTVRVKLLFHVIIINGQFAIINAYGKLYV